MDDDDRRAPRPLWWRLVLRNPRDTLIALAAAAAMTAVVVNSLFLQPGPHPAPIFAVRPPVVPVPPEATGAVALPRPRPALAEPAKPALAAPGSPARARGDIITDIQRELSRRGYYDGTVDGLYGARTDAAIRDFLEANAIKMPGEPSEAMLQAILRAPVKARSATAARRDPIADLIAPAPPTPMPTVTAPAGPAPAAAASGNARQVMSVQRALSDFGYGQVRATGVADAETKAAIERFERTRNLPVTGQVSDRLVRELGAMTGRPLD